jgi:Domain of unknown function (DUF222)/HNH endonuclease
MLRLMAYDSNMCSIVAVHEALVQLAAAELSEMDDDSLAGELVCLRRLIDATEAEWLRRLEAFDRRGGAAAVGAVSTGAWVRTACRMSPGVARDRVELARALPRWPNLADAMSAGDLSPTHARHVVAAAEELAKAAGHTVAAEAEPHLVDLASQLDPARLRRELLHVRHALAPEAVQSKAESAHEQRRLSVSETFEGMFAVDGLLDPEGGATLLTALASLAGRAGPEDHRSPRQRRADALVELARRLLDGGGLPAIGGERPHLNVIVDLATLEYRAASRPSDDTASATVDASSDTASATVDASSAAEPTAASRTVPTGQQAGAEAGAAGRSSSPAPPDLQAPPLRADRPQPTHPATGPPGSSTSPSDPVPTTDSRAADSGTAADERWSATSSGPRGRPQWVGPRAAETGWGGPLCGAAARRLACDAAVSRVITDGASQPLDVGRRTRTIPPAIRTALVVRDRGCAFPNCDRPPSWTDAHHRRHWADGGPTSLDNLVLLCRTHHRAVHEGGWQLIHDPDGRWIARRASSRDPRAA